MLAVQLMSSPCDDLSLCRSRQTSQASKQAGLQLSSKTSRPGEACRHVLHGKHYSACGHCLEPVQADPVSELLGDQAGHAVLGWVGQQHHCGGLQRDCLHEECPGRSAGLSSPDLLVMIFVIASHHLFACKQCRKCKTVNTMICSIHCAIAFTMATQTAWA